MQTIKVYAEKDKLVAATVTEEGLRVSVHKLSSASSTISDLQLVDAMCELLHYTDKYTVEETDIKGLFVLLPKSN